MTTLNISMEYHPHRPYWDYVPVPVEVINARMEVEDELVIRGRGYVNLPPGFYLVRATLPSGEVSTAHTTIQPGEESAEVLIKTSTSPHEWMAWQHFLGETPSSEAEAALPAFWLRLWANTDGSWKTIPTTEWLDYTNTDDPNFALCEVRPWQREKPALRMLQVGGDELPWRLISLPPTDRMVQALLRRSRTPTSLNGGVVVKVVSQDHDAESLSHYLRVGSYETASKVGAQVMARVEFETAPTLEFANALPEDQAERLLRDKLHNPYGALVGGYFLLKTGAYERLHNWPNNFANWFRWLPDAAMIHAWQLFGQSGLTELETARKRLLQAAGAGLPIFTDGMRYLIDGLELCLNAARQVERADEAVQDALRQARRYAGAMDWNQRLLTFYGADPSSPSLEAVTGAPADPSRLR